MKTSNPTSKTWARGHAKRGEITEDQFNTVHTAWTRTIAVLEIEEKFNLLVENYADYERELLNITDAKVRIHMTDATGNQYKSEWISVPRRA